MSGGRKDDQGKDPWHLIPWDAVRGISRVLAFGAGKYQPRNWERGMDWSRPFSACIRHLTAWHEGEKADPETGFSHLWHAGCCIFFLISYEIRGVGTDDRPAMPDVPDEHEEGELLWSAADEPKPKPDTADPAYLDAPQRPAYMDFGTCATCPTPVYCKTRLECGLTLPDRLVLSRDCP